MDTYRVQSPILLVGFIRYDSICRVFDAIKDVKPTHLYFAVDGPRPDNLVDIEKSSLVKSIADKIDWECQLKTNFREKNLGCGPGVKDAIDWFFSFEESGIILEDDVVPTNSFFRYCDELLEEYKNDQRIGMISGNNHFNQHPENESYFFSKYMGCWGWATWKRAWENMNHEMTWKNSEYRESVIENKGHNFKSNRMWNAKINLIENNQVSAWDWQWYFSLAAQNQLCIFPCKNLVSNIGFGDDATHTSGNIKSEYTTSYEIEFPLIHPKFVVPFLNYDANLGKIESNFDQFYLIKRLIPNFILTFLKKLLKKQ